MKDKIKKYVDENYKGSLRFVKEGVLNKIDKNCIKIMKEAVYDETLYTPLSLLTYCYLNDIFKHPKCKMCSELVKFNTTKKEFAIYCSNKCRLQDINSVQDKKRQTNIKRYGATNVLASEYGKQKAKETCFEKYGVDNYNKTQEYRDRIKSGDIKRVIDNEKRSLILRTKHYYNVILKWDHIEPLFSFDEYKGANSFHLYPWKCKQCNCNFTWWLNNGDIPECPSCGKKGTKIERLIMNYLKERNIQFKYRDRTKLYPEAGNGITDRSVLELDFYLPDYNIGIEVNGLRYHHGLAQHKKYHWYKTKLAEEQGIRLIHIFSDLLLNRTKRNIVYTRLDSILGITDIRYYARKSVVKHVSSSEANTFYEKYHIQGAVPCNIHYGLFCDQKMVACMSFSNTRKILSNTCDKEYELVRFSTDGSIVVGGASKLLSHFKNNHKWSKIISFADRCWSQGGLYYKLGFKNVTKYIEPNYTYTKSFGKRFSRINFQKHKLKNKLSLFDDTKTELENMIINGYYPVYDCGNLKFELLNKKDL